MSRVEQRLSGVVGDDLAKVTKVVMADVILVIGRYFDREVSDMTFVEYGQCEVTNLDSDNGRVGYFIKGITKCSKKQVRK